MSWFNWERSGPIAVRDGIKAQRSGKTSSWWGRRWLETLESFGWEGRLARGRSYAKKGQVTELTLDRHGVSAEVQGSRDEPYAVRIRLKPIAEAAWQRVSEELSDRPLYVGQLLAGELPQQIEGIFAEADAPVFPARSSDLEMSCSCPDWAVPCKHLAAVYYVLAEWIDQDPFMLFELRGKDRDAFLKTLQVSGEPAPETEPDEPMTTEGFWGADLPEALITSGPPAVRQALLRALGDPPGWTGTTLLNRLRPVYTEVSARASEVLTGDDEGIAGEE
jgi:uncharacterized Zn finger protein